MTDACHVIRSHVRDATFFIQSLPSNISASYYSRLSLKFKLVRNFSMLFYILGLRGNNGRTGNQASQIFLQVETTSFLRKSEILLLLSCAKCESPMYYM